MKKNVYWIIAGGINAFTAFVHVVGGQITLVRPLLESGLTQQEKTEWLSAWHLITVVLFLTSFYLLKFGIYSSKNENIQTTKFIGYLYILFAVVFIICSVLTLTFAPQWILLLPVGILTLIGTRK